MKQDLTALLKKYEAGIATEEELTLLLSLVQQWGVQREVLISEEEYLAIQSELSERLFPASGLKRKFRIPTLWKVAAAGAIITLGMWLYNSTSVSDGRLSPAHDAGLIVKNDIPPGKNTATLTLANGKVIDLDTNKTRVIVTDSVRTSEMLTASTPRGGQYQVVLADGTKVWLNAASKISFPNQFIGKERKISLEGEAYFEVTKNARQPFIVETIATAGMPVQRIEVLGTHFNVSAYAEEGEVTTTLLEGSVEVKGEGQTLNLVPGDQAYSSGGGIRGLKTEDPEALIAWKDGQFVFADEDVKSIMRKVARWYDVEVVYEEGFENKYLAGTISRFENVSKVLKMLKMTGTVNFKVSGRRITVMQ